MVKWGKNADLRQKQLHPIKKMFQNNKHQKKKCGPICITGWNEW